VGIPPDYETDARMQRSLNRELGADTTVLVVAHRLATIMDADRVVRAGQTECDASSSSDDSRRWSSPRARSSSSRARRSCLKPRKVHSVRSWMRARTRTSYGR
jgi:hypothetical protein